MKNADYQVVILAAGNSRRMNELTEDKPKSFLEIRGRKVIDYHLDILDRRGFRNVTIVVGYLREFFTETIGNSYKNLTLDYVVSEDYATTNHSWSLFLTRERWLGDKKPIVLIHADVFYDSRILDKVMESGYSNTTSVDNLYTVRTGDECIVRGQDDLVTSIEFDSRRERSRVIGEYMGISKWSSEFLQSFYAFLSDFFVQHGLRFNYEVSLNEFIQANGALYYVTIDDLAWININYREDYEDAERDTFDRIYG